MLNIISLPLKVLKVSQQNKIIFLLETILTPTFHIGVLVHIPLKYLNVFN